jgi:hypothetical protein
MAVTDDDQDQVVGLLLRDLHATRGSAHDWLVEANAVRLREFIEDPGRYFEQVVEDSQQDIQDEFIDTAWPQCPRHHHHPLWLHDGAWWCEQDGLRIAPIGGLAQTIGAT